MEFLASVYHYLFYMVENDREIILPSMILIIAIEVPFQLTILIAMLRRYLNRGIGRDNKKRAPYYPKVSCLVTCYNEGEDILRTLKSLSEQIYKGYMEILIIIDGANVNTHTLKAAREFAKTFEQTPKRKLRIVPKWSRSGHATSINLGMKICKGDLFVTLDGDCSCDNDMVSNVVQEFYNENMVACSGALRVRNINKNFLTKLQGVEYMLGIHMSRTGLAAVNSVNNLSSAFSVFRTKFMRHFGNYRNGSGEDFDMTIRLQSYFSRHKNLRVGHSPEAIVHTDVPEKFWQFIKQRMRWDGDIYYIYIRRYRKRLRPKYLGWRTFYFNVFGGIVLHAVQPFVIMTGLVYGIVTFPSTVFFSLMLVMYIYYVWVLIFLFLVFVVLISERKMYDLKMIYMLPLMPLYTIFSKIISSVALLSEILIKTHKDSTMAPTWVNKKVR